MPPVTVTGAVASQSFSHSAQLPVSPPEAWTALQSPSTWAAIGGVDQVGTVETFPDGDLAGFRFSSTVAGRRYPGTASVAHARRPHEMTLAITTSEIDGLIAIHIAPPAADDRIDVMLEARSKGFLAGMMFSVIASAIGNGFPQRVEAFAAGLVPGD